MQHGSAAPCSLYAQSFMCVCVCVTPNFGQMRLITFYTVDVLIAFFHTVVLKQYAYEYIVLSALTYSHKYN